MKAKRILSMLTIVSMLLSIVNITAWAEFTPTDYGKTRLIENYTAIPTWKLIYMGKDADNLSEQAKPAEFSEGDVFYIGVKIENFTQYKDAANGLFALSPAIVFDSNILKPEPTFLDLMEFSDTDLYDAGGSILNDTLKDRINTTGSYFKAGSGSLGYSLNDTMLKDATKPNGVANAKVISITPKYASNSAVPKWKADSFVTAIYEFKVKSVPADGAKVFDFSRTSDLTIQFNKGGSEKGLYYGTDQTNDLASFTDLDISAVDIFPTGVAKQTGVKIKDGTTPTLAFIEGKAITDPIASIQKVFDSGDTEDVAASGVTYYYSTTDKGAASFAAADLATGFTQVNLTNGFPTVTGTNYLYASDGKYAIKLGALTVNAATVDTITSVTATPGTVYNGDNVAFTDGQFSVKGKLTNGKDYTYTTAAQLASNGLAIYKNNSGTLSTTLGTYTVGANKATDTNTFYVAKTSDATVANAKSFNVTVTYNNTVAAVSAAQKAGVTVKYNAGDTFAANTIKANFATLKAPSGVETAFSSFPTNAKVVFAANEADAKASTDYKDASSKIAASDIGKKIYIVVDNNGIKTAVEVATLAQKSGTTYSVSTQPTKMTYTYPDTLDLTGIVFKASNPDDADVNNKTYTLAEAQTAGIYDSVKIGNTPITPGTTKLTKAESGKIAFYKGTTLVCETNAITVSPKTLGIVRDGSDTITKTYDGETTATVAVKVNSADVVSGDTVTGSVTGLTFNYNNKNVENGKAITATGTPALSGLDANKYVLAAASTITGITGNITAKALTVPSTGLTIPAAKEGATGNDLIKNAEYTFKTADGIVGTDEVKVAYTVTYTAPVEKDTTPAVTLTKGAVTGAAKDNYTVGEMPTGLTGSVTNLSAATWKETIAKTKEVKASDTTVNNETYIKTGVLTDTTFLPATGAVMVDNAEKSIGLTWKVKSVDYDVKGGKTYTYEADVASSTEFDVSGLAKPTATIKVNAVEVTAPTINAITAKVGDTAPTLPTGGNVTVEGKQIPYTITWKDASGAAVTELKTDAVINATYTGTVTYTITGNEWLTVPTAAETVTLSYSVSDKDKTVIKSVEAVEDVKTNAADPKNTADDISSLLPEKVKVKDADGKDVELAVTWATTDTYSIKGGEYTYTATFTDEVLADYDVSAITDPITAKINVTPVTASFDKKIFDELTVKKNTDNTSFESLGMAVSGTATLEPAVEGQTINYAIKWLPVSTSIDTSSTSASQKFTGTVDFTGAPEWLTLPTELTGEKTVKVKKSGGGGGGSSISITLDKSSVSGVAGTTEEVKATVKGSTSTPKWTSADEKVATVDENGNITYVGEGKTTVKVNVNGVTKTINVTVTAAAPTPTPTVKPTDEPQIDTKYTKPYASGYEDGNFLPDDYITRAELASMIARLINGDDIDDSYTASFGDVDNAWYNKYIGFLEDKDVISGYEDGTFRPNNTVTRGEMCAIIARAQRYAMISVDDMFTDVTDADWAKDYITTLASMNIVSGYNDGTFGTYSPITRAETVAIINRVLKPSTPIITFNPLDIAGHWAEADILLAVNERQINGTEVVEPTVVPEETPEATEEVTPEEETPEATTEPTATPAAE